MCVSAFRDVEGVWLRLRVEAQSRECCRVVCRRGLQAVGETTPHADMPVLMTWSWESGKAGEQPGVHGAGGSQWVGRFQRAPFTAPSAGPASPHSSVSSRRWQFRIRVPGGLRGRRSGGEDFQQAHVAPAAETGACPEDRLPSAQAVQTCGAPAFP